MRAAAIIAQPLSTMARGADESDSPPPAASRHQMSASENRFQRGHSFKAEESKHEQHHLLGQLEDVAGAIPRSKHHAAWGKDGDDCRHKGTRRESGFQAREASAAMEVDDTLSQVGQHADKGLPRIYSGEALCDQPLSSSASSTRAEDSTFNLDLEHGEQ